VWWDQRYGDPVLHLGAQQLMSSVQIDTQKLKELAAENQMLIIENLKLRARLLELGQEIKQLNSMWESDPTVKEQRPLLPDEDEGSDV